MDRTDASKFCRAELDKFGLNDWGIRLTTDLTKPFLGLCSYKDKCVILNAHHIDIHPDLDVIDIIRHEIAHCLTQGHGHDEIWAIKAREIGCTNTQPCSNLSFTPSAIDAIRSGADIELEIEETIIRTPKYKISRLQDKCEVCGKVAKEKSSTLFTYSNGRPDEKFVILECGHLIVKKIPKGTPYDSFIDFDHRNNNCNHNWVKKDCILCGANRLLPFQIEGARFTEECLSLNKGAGIFDDMGLGKTIQAIAYLGFHEEAFPVLTVTKSAIKFQFFKQYLKWLGPGYLSQVISTGKDYIFPNLKSYIISYDLLRRLPKAKLEELRSRIKTVILDECQQIKNPDSTRTQMVRNLVKPDTIKVIPLSGTPWKNRGSEFFPVLNMLDPKRFYSYQAYLDRWVEYYFHGNKRKEGGIRNPEKFREFVKDIIIRREYNEVMDEFPDINRMKLNVELDVIEQNEYNDSESEFVKWWTDVVINGDEDSGSTGLALISKLARMRHVVGLAKIPATVAFIEEYIENSDKKLVIFVHHKDVGSILYDEISKLIGDNEIKVLKYTSELSDTERFEMQQLFNNSSRAFMVASTLACGEGVDLQTCSDSIMHERQWNPQNEDQAAPGRFRRIGQLSNVINITFPEATGTVDEHLDLIVETKRLSFHSVMNKGESPVWNQGEILKELANTITKKFRDKNKLSNIKDKVMAQSK